MTPDNSLVCCLCHKLISDKARREKRQLSDAHRCSNESVSKIQQRQQRNKESLVRNRETETVEDTQFCQQHDRDSTERSRETETAQETRLCQQRNKESTATSREIETSEDTDLQQQTNREATARSQENEASEKTTLQRQCDWKWKCNRNFAFQQQNVVNITGNPLSKQCNPCNNNDSELIKQFTIEYDKKIFRHLKEENLDTH